MKITRGFLIKLVFINVIHYVFVEFIAQLVMNKLNKVNNIVSS